MKISVALCTYNGTSYITKQLDSILSIKEPPIDEIVICDDNSTDNTLEILNNYRSSYPSIFSIYVNAHNLGSTKNFEKAISLCTGDVIFLADQDDLWKEDKVRKTLAIFDLNPPAQGVFSNADIIDQNDNLIPSKTIWDSISFLEKELPKPIDFFDVISTNGNVVTGATLCITKNVKDFIFPFPTDMLHDEWIANLLAVRNILYYSDENLISYRLHNNQQVGMKNINKIKRKLHLKRIILNLEKPKTFKEYRLLSKKKYLKLNNSLKFNQLTSPSLSLTDIVLKSKDDWNKINSEIKLKFPIRFAFYKYIDAIRGKRK
jgi:glycosyltransferase involved in cell wall biosynthesis